MPDLKLSQTIRVFCPDSRGLRTCRGLRRRFRRDSHASTNSGPDFHLEPTPPQKSSDTLAQSAATKGKDLTDRLSEEEATCIRTELGDMDYQAFQTGPFVTELERAYERPLIERALLSTLFSCMNADNTSLLGIAVMDGHAGGWAGETRDCISGIVYEHPEVVYVWLGVKDLHPSVAEHVQTTHTYLLNLWDCFTDEEKVEFTVHSWSVSEGVNGQGLLEGILNEGEIGYLEENLLEGSLGSIRKVASLREAFVIPGVVSAAGVCLEPDINNRIFVGGFAKRTDGLNEESAARSPIHQGSPALHGSGAIPQSGHLDPEH